MDKFNNASFFRYGQLPTEISMVKGVEQVVRNVVPKDSIKFGR